MLSPIRRPLLAMLAFLVISLPVSCTRHVLSNADRGRSLPVAIGDIIVIRLTGVQGQGHRLVYPVSTSSAPDVLGRLSGTTDPSGGSTSKFEARSVGHATVTSATRCIPNSGRVCPSTIVPWKVTIEVN